MNLFKSKGTFVSKAPVEGLAAQLRRLASEVERGEISVVIATVIRADGGKERIGVMPGMT